jgi:hypothetical protein
MRSMVLFVFMIAALACAEKAWAHGFLVSVDGNNKLQLATEDATAGGNLSYAVQALIGSSTPKATDHPGYDAVSGFANGAQVYFDVLGPLWYSPGSGAPTVAPAGVTLSITPQDGTIVGSVSLSGLTGPQTGFLVGEYDAGELGVYQHQLYYELAKTGGLPSGAYAVAMQLRGTSATSQPYVESDPFVAVFNNGVSVGSLPTVASQLYTVAIPEPSAFVLAAMAGVALFALGGRRLRRRV